MVKVSVIVPVYNAAEHLEMAMDSIIMQDMKEMEVICAYDYSADDSFQILKRYAEKDLRVKILVNEKKGTLSDARNLGFKEALGKYIFFMDADDELKDGNSISRLYQVAEKYHTDLITFDSSYIWPGREMIENVNVAKNVYDGVYVGQELFAQQIKNGDYSYGGVWKLFLSRQMLVSNNILNYPGIVCEDYLFCANCFLCAQRAMCLNEIFYIHYRWENSLYWQRVGVERIRSTVIVCVELIRLADKIELIPQAKAGLEDVIIKCYNALFSHVKRAPECEIEFEDLQMNILWKNVKSRFYGDATRQKVETILKEIPAEKVYLYGAGARAREITDIVDEREVEICGFIVSSIKDNPHTVLGHKVYELNDSEQLDKEIPVLITIGTIFNDTTELPATIKEYGFTHVYQV